MCYYTIRKEDKMTKQDLILTIAILNSIRELLEKEKIDRAKELIDSYLNSLIDD